MSLYDILFIFIQCLNRFTNFIVFMYQVNKSVASNLLLFETYNSFIY